MDKSRVTAVMYKETTVIKFIDLKCPSEKNKPSATRREGLPASTAVDVSFLNTLSTMLDHFERYFPEKL